MKLEQLCLSGEPRLDINFYNLCIQKILFACTVHTCTVISVSLFPPLSFPLQIFSLLYSPSLNSFLSLSFSGYSLFSFTFNSFSLSLFFRIIAAVRTLLSLIPINQKVLEALEVFVHPISSQGASEDTRLPPSPKAVLSEFYDAAAVSPTLLLYNLEVYIHVHILHFVHACIQLVLYICTHVHVHSCLYKFIYTTLYKIIMVLIIMRPTCTCTIHVHVLYMYLHSISHCSCLGNKP